MFKNYFKTAWRTLLQNRLYSVLNIAGLTFGMTCFFLIGLFLFDEVTFDSQHTKGERIYRVIQDRNINGDATTIAAAGFKLAQEAKTRISGVENATRIQRLGRANLVNPARPIPFQETVTAADENFLKIFDFALSEGDRATALKEPNSIIINEDLARRLFGVSSNVVGKTVKYSFQDVPLTVTGLLQKNPANSSFDFNNIMSESTFYSSDNFRQLMVNDWASANF
jgi:putative ABC transport system permease protein